MLNDIWIYKKSAKIFVILLFIAIFALFTQNWQIGLLVFILVAGSLRIYTDKTATRKNTDEIPSTTYPKG